MTSPIERLARAGLNLGLELAVRSGVAPVLLGLRWAGSALLDEFPHAPPPRPWLVCVPGYPMGHPAVDFTGFRARWLPEGPAAAQTVREKRRVSPELSPK